MNIEVVKHFIKALLLLIVGALIMIQRDESNVSLINDYLGLSIAAMITFMCALWHIGSMVIVIETHMDEDL